MFKNNITKYGLIAKIFHWLTFLILIAQIPFGFYLVDLEFSEARIELEDIHILIGISIFYLVLFRLIWKLINPTPKPWREFFKGQIIIANINHYLLYISIFTITGSGALKKLYMGEKLNFFFFKYQLKDFNFELSDIFYSIHIYSNYLLIALICIHIFAVITHHIFFKDKILNKIF
tara:strand:+ start:22 stop:549 length:528 start_codon:yes stop_codon:yes gene_type:complete